MGSIQTAVGSMGSWSGQVLRRWFVESVVLSDANQYALTQMEAPESVIRMAQGDAPTPEHAAISARMLYKFFQGGRDYILTSMPTLADPSTWDSAPHMAHLLLFVFEPWTNWRYDPKTEAVWVTTHGGQWVGHLKGKDTERTILAKIRAYCHSLRSIGFPDLIQHLNLKGLVSLDPKDYGMDAQQFSTALMASEGRFGKFLSKESRTQLVETILSEPIMFFDTSTLNSVRNFQAFGNGVVPTTDIRDYEASGEFTIRYPAGRLLQSDPEFMIGSAAGVEWPINDEIWNKIMEHRYSVDTQQDTLDSWEDWFNGSRSYVDQIFATKAPTYKEFLDHAFPGEFEGDVVERDAFLRLLGAAVFGSNLKLVAAMIGAPNAGKDTVLKWLTYILGESQVGVLSQSALTAQADEQRSFAPLKGARLAIVSGEVGEGRSNALLAEKIKSITSGGSLLTVAEKYEKPTTIFFDGMLILQGNSVPTIIGGDKALFQNRMIAVEFKHPFPLQAYSYEREYRSEAPYFLQVLFFHYLDYVERGSGMVGIDPPKEWVQFSQEFEFNADPLEAVMKCITPPNKSAISIPTPQFYKALSILAERTLGLKYPISSVAWSKRLRKAGVQIPHKKNSPWRSNVARSDYNGSIFHFTLDATHSDGLFNQSDWESALADAAVSAGFR
jgi:hypothetical protein